MGVRYTLLATREKASSARSRQAPTGGVWSPPSGYNVRLWDVATRRLVASCALWDKISCLRMPTSNLLLAGDNSGNIYCLELEQ